MHPAAYQFVQDRAKSVSESSIKVLEFGSYNVNGSVRELFPNATWLGVDSRRGPCVDVVADAATYEGELKSFDLVICCEVFEHTFVWPDIVKNAARHLKPGGLFIGTAAGPGRAPHGCNGGPFVEGVGEVYANVDPQALWQTLALYFVRHEVDVLRDDVRWIASHPKPYLSGVPTE